MSFHVDNTKALDHIRYLYNKGNQIEAIKLVYSIFVSDTTNMIGLKEAKNFVEELCKPLAVGDRVYSNEYGNGHIVAIVGNKAWIEVRGFGTDNHIVNLSTLTWRD